MAAIEQTIAKQAIRATGKLPSRIQNAPAVKLGLELYWFAFFDLTSCRTAGFSVSEIPWTAISEYSNFHRLDEEQSETLFFLIRQMDMEYLKYINKKTKT